MIYMLIKYINYLLNGLRYFTKQASSPTNIISSGHGSSSGNRGAYEELHLLLAGYKQLQFERKGSGFSKTYTLLKWLFMRFV